ncbi:MAG: phage scaffolding protein [Paraclostridium sordellii]
MDWLKEILSKAEVKDNKLQVDEIIKNVNVEIPKYFVPKSDYENANLRLDEANTTIKSLQCKTTKDDIEALKKEHKVQLNNLELKYKKVMNEKEFNYELEKVLNSTNCKDIKDIKSLLSMEGIKYRNGQFEGLDEQIKDLKQNKCYLFKDSKDDQYTQNPYYKIVGSSGVPANENSISSQISDAINGNI